MGSGALGAADHVKVYQIVDVPGFFSGFCAVDDGAVKRTLYAYDVEYDGDVWRRDELVEHLLDWLPKVAAAAADPCDVQPPLGAAVAGRSA